jgi:hypothetical protein
MSELLSEVMHQFPLVLLLAATSIESDFVLSGGVRSLTNELAQIPLGNSHHLKCRN